MKEIWLPTSQWPWKLADGKETRSSRWDRVVWRGGQNYKGRSTTPREVIEFQEYKDQYCSGKVQGWRENIELLAEIAKNQPHNAYIAFTKGCKLKFAYFMRRIDSWRLCGTSWWSDQRYFRSSSFWSDGTAPWGVARTIHPTASTRGSGYTRHESWSPTAIRCLKVNNSTAWSSYMYAEHLHASGWANCGRPETTTALTQDDSSDYEKRGYWCISHTGLAKGNNAGQRQGCKLVAQRRNPWGAGPDIE